MAAVLEFASNDSMFLEHDEHIDDNELCTSLKKNGFRFKAIIFSSCDPSLIKFVYEEGLYEPNAKILEGFMELIYSKGNLLESGKLLTAIFSLGKCSIKEKVQAEKEFVVSSVIGSTKGNLCDEPNCISWIVNDDKVNKEICLEYINKLSDAKISDLSEINDYEIRISLVENNLVLSTAKNIEICYKDCNESMEGVFGEYINQNGIPRDLTDGFLEENGVDARDFLFKFLRRFSISRKLLQGLLSQYELKLDYLNGEEIDGKCIDILIETENLQMNTDVLTYLRENCKDSVENFILRNYEEYLGLVLPCDDVYEPTLLFMEDEALQLLNSEGLTNEQKTRLLSGFENGVSLSSSYTNEINIEIARSHFDGNFDSVVELYPISRGELRKELIKLTSEHVSQIAEEEVFLPEDILKEVFKSKTITRNSSLKMVEVWMRNSKPSRDQVLLMFELASLDDYAGLLNGTSKMIPKSNNDDSLLNQLHLCGMCGKITAEVNSQNLRRVYPKGASRKDISKTKEK